MKARSSCSEAVRAALREPGTVAIRRAADAGADFTCGDAFGPMPLDDEIMTGRPDRVEALLEAGADPNARWSPLGDRHPLQEAIYKHPSDRDRREFVRLLLRHGADPNARWCPFESRAGPGNLLGCSSAEGMTPLIMAAVSNQADSTYLLLDAGADPTLTDSSGASALDYAHSDAVFQLLVAAQFRDLASRHASALRYLTERELQGFVPGPWDQTALSTALSGFFAQQFPSPPSQGVSSRPGDRVRLILSLGADPNERMTWGVDWTPLALALAQERSAVESLLRHGADPDARWCTVAPELRQGPWQKQAGCDPTSGTTPLMFAASMGNDAMVTLLLKYKADPTLRDWNGRTALDHARLAGRATVVGALEPHTPEAVNPN
jgi:ankyrin repeat protein